MVITVVGILVLGQRATADNLAVKIIHIASKRISQLGQQIRRCFCLTVLDHGKHLPRDAAALGQRLERQRAIFAPHA